MATWRVVSNIAFALVTALGMLAATQSLGQDKSPFSDALAKIDTTRLMLVDGPYELDGASGVFGFVVARAGSRAKFRPCTGPMIDVDQNKLKRTSSNCSDEPPANGNPLSAGCGGGIEVPSKMMAAIDANAESAAPGTLMELGTNAEVNVLASSNSMAMQKIKGIYSLTSCGSWTVGYDAEGVDVMHFLSTDDAKSGAYMKGLEQ